MSPPVSLHPEALIDASEARRWYASRSLEAARGFVLAIGDALGQITDAPQRWPHYLHGTRRLLLRRYPFAIVYRVYPDRILVVAIAHQRRRPGYWRSR